MKNLFVLFLSLMTTVIFAQEVKESSEMLSLGNQPGYSVDIEGGNKKIAEKVWKQFMKDMDNKVKKNKKAKEWYSEKASLNGVNGNTPMDVYFKMEERKDMVSVFIAADRGDAFISGNTTPDEDKAMRTIVFNYAVEVMKKVTEEEIKDEEDRLKDLRKDLEKLEKKNGNYHNDIKKAEEKIREAEENIEQNLKDQETKKAEIEAQIKEVEMVTEKYNNLGKKF